jgi:hypothetical protein
MLNLAAPAKLFAQLLKDRDPALGEPSQQQHAFPADGVDDVAYLLVVKQQVNKLSDFDVVDGDVGFTLARNHQVSLFRALAEPNVPCGYTVDAAASNNRAL